MEDRFTCIHAMARPTRTGHRSFKNHFRRKLLYAVSQVPVSNFHPHLSFDQQLTALAVGAVLVGGVTWFFLRRKRPTGEEIERARRERLVRVGRITDGSLIDSATQDGLEEPTAIIFRYQIAGVVYEAVQNVSALPEKVTHMRFDLPIQVRYDYQNPANSIAVAEEWSGVRQRA